MVIITAKNQDLAQRMIDAYPTCRFKKEDLVSIEQVREKLSALREYQENPSRTIDATFKSHVRAAEATYEILEVAGMKVVNILAYGSLSRKDALNGYEDIDLTVFTEDFALTHDSERTIMNALERKYSEILREEKCFPAEKHGPQIIFTKTLEEIQKYSAWSSAFAEYLVTKDTTKLYSLASNSKEKNQVKMLEREGNFDLASKKPKTSFISLLYQLCAYGQPIIKQPDNRISSAISAVETLIEVNPVFRTEFYNYVNAEIKRTETRRKEHPDFFR